MIEPNTVYVLISFYKESGSSCEVIGVFWSREGAERAKAMIERTIPSRSLKIEEGQILK